MANRLQVRHGSTSPTNSDLLPYELGWDGNDLYINNNGTIKNVAEHIASGYLPLTGGILTGNLNMGTTSMVNGAKIVWYSKHNSGDTSRQIWAGYANGANTFYLYDSTNQNGIISSTATGSTTFYGNATSATKATQDGNGNTISSTYLKLSGGSDLTITKAGEVNIYINNTAQGHNISLCAGTSGKGGIYDNTNSKWIVYAESNGAVVLNGGASQIITKGTVATRNVYVTTSASVPSGAVAGDIVLVKV